MIYVNPIHHLRVADLINSGESFGQIVIGLKELAITNKELAMKQEEIRKTLMKDNHTPTETPTTIGLNSEKNS